MALESSIIILNTIAKNVLFIDREVHAYSL